MTKQKKTIKQKTRKSGRSKRGKQETAATKSASPVVVSARDQLVPDVMSTDLLYADQFSLVTGGASYIQQQWKANSAYDPDYTNAGAQPSGFDQYAAFYGFYKVFRTEFEITITPSSKPLSVTIYPSPNVTIATTFGAQASQPHSVTGTCSVYQQIKLKMNLPIARHLGVDSSEFADVVYGADIGSNPTRLLYLTLVAMNQDNSVGVTCYISFKMRMFMQFQQRTYLGLSLLSSSGSGNTIKPVSDVKPQASSSSTLTDKPKRTIKSLLSEFDLID